MDSQAPIILLSSCCARRSESPSAHVPAAATELLLLSFMGPVWDTQVSELCDAANEKVGYDSVRIANFLCNGNYAISGGDDGCQAVQDLAKSKGARMTVKLAVAGAFHTSYMQPAQEQLQ